MNTSRYSDPEKQQKYMRARKRTEAIRKFYKHLVIYVLVNIAISGIKVREYYRDGDSFDDIFSKLDIYIVWLVWGAFVVLQAIRTFRSNVILGSDWEERKIREYMNENNG